MKTIDHNPESYKPLKEAVKACVLVLADACKAAGLPHVIFAVVAVNTEAENPAQDLQVASNLEPAKPIALVGMRAGLGAPSAEVPIHGKGH